VRVRGLLFDFDGLLLDTETPSRRAFEDLYRDHGHELPHDDWATVIGTLGAEFEPYTHLEELVGAKLDRQQLDERRRAREDELCDLEELRPGIDAYLAEADRRGLIRAIVSSSSRPWIDRHLKRLACSNGWQAIVTADGDPERAKPRPTLYLEALEAIDVEADEAIAFEDSPNGVRAAKAAGLFCVAIPNPATETLALDVADLVLDSLEDISLPDLLARF
jgi:HAD superfamily hydrolase (TIGR01509 family)